MNLTNDDVQDILQLVKSCSFNEMNLQTDRFKLSLRRSSDGEWTQSSQVLSKPELLEPVAGAAVAASDPDTAKSAFASVDGLAEIRTPLLGTFYRAPKPGSPPYVEVGSIVTESSVVAIVETMKLMNSVHAGVSGRIVEICLDDAEFADHDAVLMRVQPEVV